MIASPHSPGAARNVPYAMIGMAHPELRVYTGDLEDKSKGSAVLLEAIVAVNFALV